MHCCHLDLVRQIVNLLYVTKRDVPDPNRVMLMSSLIFHQTRKIERSENSLNWYHLLKTGFLFKLIFSGKMWSLDFLAKSLHQDIEWWHLTRLKLLLTFRNGQNCYNEVFRTNLKFFWFKSVLKITCFGVRASSDTLQDKVFS